MFCSGFLSEKNGSELVVRGLERSALVVSELVFRVGVGLAGSVAWGATPWVELFALDRLRAALRVALGAPVVALVDGQVVEWLALWLRVDVDALVGVRRVVGVVVLCMDVGLGLRTVGSGIGVARASRVATS